MNQAAVSLGAGSSGSALALIILATVLGIGALFVALRVGRSILRRNLSDSGSDQIAFTLGDLRDLFERGEITAAEFEALRGAMIRAAKARPAPRPVK